MLEKVFSSSLIHLQRFLQPNHKIRTEVTENISVSHRNANSTELWAQQRELDTYHWTSMENQASTSGNLLFSQCLSLMSIFPGFTSDDLFYWGWRTIILPCSQKGPCLILICNKKLLLGPNRIRWQWGSNMLCSYTGSMVKQAVTSEVTGKFKSNTYAKNFYTKERMGLKKSTPVRIEIISFLEGRYHV